MAVKTAATGIPQALRNAWPAAVAIARQVAVWRLALTTAVIVTLVAVALLVPVPTAVQLRDWAQTLGPWFPLAFLAAHTVVTVLPFPVPRSPSPPACCSGPGWALSWRCRPAR